MNDCTTCAYGHYSYDEEPCSSCQEVSEDLTTTAYRNYVRRKELTVFEPAGEAAPKNDGSSADYYTLPVGASQLQDLISFRNMNAQMGEIFRACYRYGQDHHSSRERDLKKIIFYAQAELDRLEKYDG